MTTTKTTVQKLGRSKWTATLFVDAWSHTLHADTKTEADAHVTVAEALVAATRAAVQVRYSYLDYAMMSATDDLRSAARRLGSELARVQRDATEDAQRLTDGCNLWRAGNFGRMGAEVDALHAEWKAAWKLYCTLAGVVRHAEPTGYAAVGLAVAGFVSGQAVL